MINGAKNNTAVTEEELCIDALVFMVAAIIALATVVLLPVVAQVIAFVVMVKWLKTKIFH
jgi:hypothetical protein